MDKKTINNIKSMTTENKLLWMIDIKESKNKKKIVLNYKYYDLIKSGKKKIELRSKKAHDNYKVEPGTIRTIKRGYTKEDTKVLILDVLDFSDPKYDMDEVKKLACYDGDLDLDCDYGYVIELLQ